MHAGWREEGWYGEIWMIRVDMANRYDKDCRYFDQLQKQSYCFSGRHTRARSIRH